MTAELKRDDIDGTDDQDTSDEIKGSDEQDDQADNNSKEDQAFLDDLDKLKFVLLDLSAPVSNARRSDSIEDLRERVANSKRSVLVGDFNGIKRVAILRNGVRLITFEIDVPGLTDERARKIACKRILRGDFDYHLTTLYHEKWAKLKH